MKRITFTLLALLLCIGGFAQSHDSIYVYRGGNVVRSFLRSRVDSITYSKTGLDGKLYDDYVSQVIHLSGSSSILALSTIDSLTFAKPKVYMQPEVVDLGLSVKWASFNVGATAPEGYGSYFAWGETTEKTNYTWDTYKFYDATSQECADIGVVISGTQYDAAHTLLGNGWRMPTKEEVVELLTICTPEWMTVNGVEGARLTAPNGKSIFLPAAGYRFEKELKYTREYGRYWSGSVETSNTLFGVDIFFDSAQIKDLDSYRRNGFPIRAVKE